MSVQLNGTSEVLECQEVNPLPVRPVPTETEAHEHNITDPHRLAKTFLTFLGRQDGIPKLRYWKGRWWFWGGSCYTEWKEDTIKSKLTTALQHEFDQASRRLRSFLKQVTADLVSNVVLHLKALVWLEDDVEQPSWIDGKGHQPAAEYLAFPNGLLHLPTYLDKGADYLVPPTPAFFSPNAVEFDFTTDPPKGERWLRFLSELWPDDPDNIFLLQEWFGYSLTPDTRYDKIFLMIGPKRAGKGTVARILADLVGRQNTAEMMLATLATPFGPSLLIGKTVAIFGDVRLSNRVDLANLTERLLTISGNNGIDINAKYKDPAVFRLPIRFTMVSNKVPYFQDPIIGSRFLILPFSKSWYDSPDPNLTDDLRKELPFIMKWALEGLRRLRNSKPEGRFTEPAAAKDTRNQLEIINSPVERFVAEWCEVGPNYGVGAKLLFDHYCHWWKANVDSEPPKTSRQFVQDLLAVVPSVRHKQVKIEGRNIRGYVGIRPQLQTER